MGGKVFHVISNTHWDREWRFPFERNRQMLVEMIDATIDILLSEPSYRAFHLDSQSILLEDYLAVRPERRATIKKLVHERRLLVGPWFVLPDEFQVGGEHLIRNLLFGHRTSTQLGGVMKVGYSPFSWGHVSQLPQIYSEFGIDVVMFYRGVNVLDTPKAEFIWEGADGTRVLASRFSTMPRYNFYFYVYRPVVYNEQIPDIEYEWHRAGTPFHFADLEFKGEDYALLEPVDGYFRENIIPSVRALIQKQAEDFTTPHVLWADGHDSSGPSRKTVRIIRDIQELLPDLDVRHSTLEEYARELEQSVDTASLTIVKGERRSSQFDARSTNLYGYTTSARMYLKQKNFEAEKWLQFYAEPLNAIAGILGKNINDQYLNMAWHTLLENSAHDSIGGCSLDEVHEDMMGRYKKAIEISKGVFDRAVKYIARNINLSSSAPDGIHLVAFNPAAYARREVVEAFVDVPAGMDKGGIEVFSSHGDRCLLQEIDSRPFKPVLEQMTDRPMYLAMRRYHCFIETPVIPSFGYTSMTVKPSRKRKRTPAKKIGRTRAGLPILENEHLVVHLQKNGALTVVHKGPGKTYKEIGYFYDEGEAGNAWIHDPVGPIATTLKSRPKISFQCNGHLRGTVTVRHEVKIPVSLEARSKKPMRKVGIPIEMRVTLDKGSKRVDFEVTVNNVAESHRLRIMFPMGIQASRTHAEGQFDVVQRQTGRPDTRNWVEQPMYDYPLHQFVDLHDGQAGAAILVGGLKEYELLEDNQKTLAVTLLRGFKYVIQPSSVQDFSHQKGSQCLGVHRYRLAFQPHMGSWEEARIYAEAMKFNNEPRLCEIGSTDGLLPAEHSFIQIEPDNLIFSCFKQAEDRKPGAFILRVYNPADVGIQGRVAFSFTIKNAALQTLEELHVADIPLATAQSFELAVPPKKIKTIRLEF